jgi:hypothetical protein
MRYAGLHHLNTYTFAGPTWFPDMDPELRAMFERVTKGSLSGKAGETAQEDFKINGQYVDSPDQGVVGIPFFDGYVEQAALDFLDEASQSDEPATRRSAAPRAPCARAATGCRRSRGCWARSRPASRATTSRAAST